MPTIIPRTIRTLVPAALLLVGAQLPPAAANADSTFCAREKPESILECLSACYKTRDIEAFTALLAPEFDYRFLGAGPGSTWDRTEEIEGTGRLFQSEQVRSIDLELGSPGEVVAEAAGTWLIRSFTTTLTVLSADPKKEPLVLTNPGTQTLRVRLEPAPEPHFVIVEWTDQAQ